MFGWAGRIWAWQRKYLSELRGNEIFVEKVFSGESYACLHLRLGMGEVRSFRERVKTKYSIQKKKTKYSNGDLNIVYQDNILGVEEVCYSAHNWYNFITFKILQVKYISSLFVCLFHTRYIDRVRLEKPHL